MSDTTDTSHYALVESLYGPGTVGAWLLTILSVTISWTRNKQHRNRDTISIDTLTMLLLPIVSAGHLLYQIKHLENPIALTLTSADEKNVQLAAAIEAPLNICESFSMAALFLAVPCGPWWEERTVKWKRLSAVVVTGLLSWGTENLLFFEATRRGVRAGDIMMSRPYVFLFTPIMVGSWAFLAVCVAVGFGGWVVVAWARRRKDEGKTTAGRAEGAINVPPVPITREHSDSHTTSNIPFDIPELRAATRKDVIAVQLMTVFTILFLPASLFAAFFSTGVHTTKVEAVATTTTEESPAKVTRTWFFLPKSRESISSIDQWLALSAGCLVLVYSIFGAYESRVRVESQERMVERRRSI